MAITQYKVWTSLTEPIVYKGITFDYLVTLFIAVMVVYVLTFNNELIAISASFCGLIFGYIMSRKDKRWFSVLFINVKYFGSRPFGNRRYVR